MCDNCVSSTEVEDIDVSRHAKVMISLIEDMQASDQKVTMLQLVDKMKAKLKQQGLDLKRDHMEQLVIQLIIERVLKEEYQHTAYATNAYVNLGPLAKQVMQGKKTVKLQICSSEQGNKSVAVKRAKRKPTSSSLEFRLDELRKELASLHGGIFPHSILSTQQISIISAEKSDSMEQLEKIIGKVKSGKFGTRILEEIARSFDPDKLDESEGNGEQAAVDRASKKTKTKKSLVVLESSEGEE